jgi:CBS domain-containing protein
MSELAAVMRREYITVAPEDTLGEVAQKMVEVNTGAVLVKDHGRLIGILTERDMLKAMAGRVHTSDARVREWMTADPITASPSLPVQAAAEIMLEHGFRHLPVLEGETVVGVVSLRQAVGARLGSPDPAP